ncbi:hypothetical protein [Nocardioides sp. Leaf285]|uniref:hypothetical protein n=1 Tax=Nocardioides sp. Leaf285 TaxID=1736322 RepID=UPI0012EA7816|nr:hypothetical protein [Nocardioides sp. Leaf285]
MTTTPPSDEPSDAPYVALALLSSALDEIHALRMAFSYEVSVNRTTLGMRVPGAVARVLTAADEDLLIPAALGGARDAFDRPGPTLDPAAWEEARALSRLAGTPLSKEEISGGWIASRDLYRAALDEIAALRRVAAQVAALLPEVLVFKTLPASRRDVVEAQIARLTRAADGEAEAAYPGRYTPGARLFARQIGAKVTFNTATFMAEEAERTHPEPPEEHQ